MKAVVHHYKRIRSLALLGGGHCKRIQGINCIRMLTRESKIPCRFIIHKNTHSKEVEIIIFTLMKYLNS